MFCAITAQDEKESASSNGFSGYVPPVPLFFICVHPCRSVVKKFMRARTGKIARLPAPIRNELNRRLNNGALGRELVPWLNALPEVQSVLAHRFANRPITEDNISAWRHGGFKEWLLEEERHARLRELSDQCPERDPVLRARRIEAFTEEQLALELAEELERLSAMTDRDARSKRLQRLCQELCRLQNSHTRHREIRLMELKATHALAPKSSANRNPFVAKSGLSGPFRANDHKGEG